MKYRSRTEIVSAMLRIANRGATKTRIMYGAYLSYAQVMEYPEVPARERTGQVQSGPRPLHTDIERYGVPSCLRQAGGIGRLGFGAIRSVSRGGRVSEATPQIRRVLRGMGPWGTPSMVLPSSPSRPFSLSIVLSEDDLITYERFLRLKNGGRSVCIFIGLCPAA